MSLALARQAASRWSLSEASVELIAERENKTYCAFDADSRRVALRLHRDGYVTESEILSELAWLGALNADGVPVPSPMTSANGLFVETVEDRLFSVLSWMPGKPMGRSGTPLELDDRCGVLHNLGAVLARLHKSSDNWSPPASFQRRSWDIDGLFGDAPVWGRFWENPYLTDDDRDLIEAARKTALSDLNAANGTLDYGLIHADALRENVLVDGSDVHLIDFDDSGYGFRLFDLSTTLLRHRDEPDYAGLQTAMLQGYRTVRPIDTAHLPLFIVIRAFTYLGWIVPRINESGGKDRCAHFVREAVDVSRRYLDGQV